MKTVFLFAALLCGTQSFAQQLKGRVVDGRTNAPLNSASVSFEGKGTTTGKDGNFSIKCENKTATLIVSYIGFETYKTTITDCDQFQNISLPRPAKSRRN